MADHPVAAIAVDFYDTIATVAPTVPPWDAILADRGFALDRGALARWGDTSTDGRRTTTDQATHRADVEVRRRHLFTDCGVPAGRLDELLDAADRWDQDYAVVALPGALDAVATLGRLGLPLVLASNWGWDLDRHLAALGLAEAFTAVVCSSWEGVHKPHPAFYDRVAEVAGVPARRVLFVGDGPETDVAGPQRAGMATVHLVAGAPPLPPVRPLAATSPSLADVASALATCLHRGDVVATGSAPIATETRP